MSKPRKPRGKLVRPAKPVPSLPFRRAQAGVAFLEQRTRVASILISQGGAYLSTPAELAAKTNVKQLTGQYRQQFAKLQELGQLCVDLDAEAKAGRG